MNQKFRVIFCLIISILSWSCSRSSTNQPLTSLAVSDPTPTHELNVTVLPTLISTPSLVPTNTHKIVISPSDTEEAPDIEKKPLITCNEIRTEEPGEDAMDGSIIYQDREQGAYLSLGGAPLTRTKLPLKGLENDIWRTLLFDLSPDGEWLPYLPISGPVTLLKSVDDPLDIGLLSASGEKKTYLLNEADLSYISSVINDENAEIDSITLNNWINNTYSIVAVWYRSPGTSKDLSAIYTVADPFLGLLNQELPNQLKNINLKYAFSISPDLTRALYTDIHGNLILWDLENNQQLWIDSTYLTSGNLVFQWSPDSKYVIYAKYIDPEGIFLLDRDGKIRKDLLEVMKINSIYALDDIRWSNDGFLIAFIMEDAVDEGVVKTVRVYDLLSDSSIYQCILPKVDGGAIAKIFWSPNNDSLALSYGVFLHLYVFNVNTGDARKLADRAIIYGWSPRYPFSSPSK